MTSKDEAAAKRKASAERRVVQFRTSILKDGSIECRIQRGRRAAVFGIAGELLRTDERRDLVQSVLFEAARAIERMERA